MTPLRQLFATSYFAQILWFTTWQAALSTLLTLILALPGAYVFARYRFPGKSLILALTTIPFVLPTLVVATAFTALIGSRGLVKVSDREPSLPAALTTTTGSMIFSGSFRRRCSRIPASCCRGRQSAIA